MQLEKAKILGRGRIRCAAEKGCKCPDVTDIVVVRLLDEVAHRHVFDHAPAQRADGLITHRGAPVLRWRLLDPSILKTGRPACHYLPLTSSLHRCHWLRSARSALPRSGFVLWHFPDIADLADDVCFVGAKRTSKLRRLHPTPACSAMSMLDPTVTTGSTI